MELAILATIIFGMIAVWLSIARDRERKLFLTQEALRKDKISKLTILTQIQNRTAYSEDLEKATDVIMETVRKLFPYSTASSMVIKDKKIIFKTYIEEQISKEYMQKIKESMLLSISTLGKTMPEDIDERIYGVSLNDSNFSNFLSSFHIPLILGSKVEALIHLSSTKEGLYKDKDMEILYQIIEQVSSHLAEFREVIDVERNKLISLVKSIGDGIFAIDNKNNLILINNAAIKTLGIEKADMGFFDVINAFPAKLDLTSKVNNVILNNTPLKISEIKIKDKITDIFINPIENNRASVVMHDITEAKKEDTQKEDSMHIMVHELRAPITTIKDSAELIITTYDSLEREKQLKFLEIIHTQSKIILDQISSILDTAKLDAGRFTIQKTEGDIGKLIKSEVTAFIPQAEKKRISLNYNIPSPLPLTYFDPIRITQTINNLLSNSIKFTPEGGEVKIEADYRPIQPGLENTSEVSNLLKSLDKFIVISVTDNGIGIPQEQQKYLFSKFSQAKATPEKLTKLGTGLGLYVVKGIVEAHGGKVWVKSLPGQGTTISFTLPAEGANVEISKPKSSIPEISSFGKTVN